MVNKITRQPSAKSLYSLFRANTSDRSQDSDTLSLNWSLKQHIKSSPQSNTMRTFNFNVNPLCRHSIYFSQNHHHHHNYHSYNHHNYNHHAHNHHPHNHYIYNHHNHNHHNHTNHAQHHHNNTNHSHNHHNHTNHFQNNHNNSHYNSPRKSLQHVESPRRCSGGEDKVDHNNLEKQQHHKKKSPKSSKITPIIVRDGGDKAQCSDKLLESMTCNHNDTIMQRSLPVFEVLPPLVTTDRQDLLYENSYMLEGVEIETDNSRTTKCSYGTIRWDYKKLLKSISSANKPTDNDVVFGEAKILLRKKCSWECSRLEWLVALERSNTRLELEKKLSTIGALKGDKVNNVWSYFSCLRFK